MTREIDPTEYGLKIGTATSWRNLSLKAVSIDDTKRTVVARVSADTVDEEGEVVLPEGIDYSRFLKTGGVVFYNHEYDKPCGVCISIRKTEGGLLATTRFPERPVDYKDEWLPDKVFAMFASDPPIVRSFSIGFAYLETRNPTAKDFKRYGTEDLKRIVSKSRLLEYSVAPLPMNADATAIAINKTMQANANLADNPNTQVSITHLDSSRISEGAELESDLTRPERDVSQTSNQKESIMADIDGIKKMMDLNSSTTLGQLAQALAMHDDEDKKDKADRVREEVEEKVRSKSEDDEDKKKMDDEDEKKAHGKEDEDKKKSFDLSQLAAAVKSLNDNAVTAGRSRVSGGMPIVSAPRSNTKLKHLGDHDTAYAFGKTILAAAGHKSSGQWIADRFGKKAHSESNNSLGGFLVPDELDQAIIDLRAEYGKFRANTRVLNMNRDVLQINRRAGGMTAVSIGENGTFTESDNTFDQVQLTAAKFGVLTKVSSELLEDAVINLGDYVAGEIAYAFANKEDECGFNGDGTSTFAGIVGLKDAVGSAGINSVAATGDIYAGLAISDLNGVVGKAPEYVFSRTTPKWYFSSQFYYGAVQKVMYGAGGNTIDTIAGGGAQQLFGYPVVLSDVLPKTHATSTIFGYFGALDLSSTMGDRRPTEVATSTDFAFNQDQTAIRGTTRFDIVNHDCGDSSEAGAIVALKSNAS